ncbi:unnamed protein product [Symbiodinium microadriaticum]|nr:unnamed protein product [Symbiodinium microadriaticum]
MLTSGRLLYCRGRCYSTLCVVQSDAEAPEETKSIGLVGGAALASLELVHTPYILAKVMLLINNLAGYMLIEAMRCMPGNHGFEQTIEFTNLASFYLPYEMYVATMVCYHVNSILNLMSLIIQSGQVMDYIMLNVYGCAPGIQLGLGVKYVCGTRKDSATPFGDSLVLSSSMLAVALICAPFAVRNLDDNVILQYLAACLNRQFGLGFAV